MITDLAHTVDIPSLDPRTWSLQYAPPATGEGASPVDAACVSIDILDEDHSLRLAMRRLAADRRLRDALGRSARELWATRFSLDRMVSGYREAIDAAVMMPASDATLRERLPAHFMTNGAEDATRLLQRMGLSRSRIAAIWHSDADLQTPYSPSDD